MVKKINWKSRIAQLKRISLELYKDKNLTKEAFIQKLSEIFPEFKILQGDDTRTIAFLEFCFYMADGPYSRKFAFFITLLRKIFRIYPPLRGLLNRSGAAAIGNMVLGAKGKLKLEISDLYELRIILRAWKKMGLKPESPYSILKAVMEKRAVQKKIKENNPFLLARLREIFPMFKDKFLKKDYDLNLALYEHFKSRFDTVIDYYEKKGYSIEEMIRTENERKMPVGVSRNNLLAFLVKKFKSFRCQACEKFNLKQARFHQIQVHHIIPLSEGGGNESSNMLVLCERHHKEVHQGKMTIEPFKKIIIRYKGRKVSVDYN